MRDLNAVVNLVDKGIGNKFLSPRQVIAQGEVQRIGRVLFIEGRRGRIHLDFDEFLPYVGMRLIVEVEPINPLTDDADWEARDEVDK